MKSFVALSALILLGPPAFAAPASAPIAESARPHSNVSVFVDPQLNDGRLVVKIAAQNRSTQPVPFGPGSVAISKPTGEAIELSSLEQLIDDVRVAAGMAPAGTGGGTPTAGTYAAPSMPIDASGRPDVSGYTGSSAVAGDEIVRRSDRERQRGSHSLDRKTAEAEIARLQQAILQDANVEPLQIAVGEVVSQKLNFKKGESRTLYLRVRLAGDEHDFTIAAPPQ